MGNVNASFFTDRKFIVSVLVTLFVGFFIGAKVESARLKGVYAAQQTTQQANAPTPQSTETLNKTYSFPIKDATGKVIMSIQYVIEDAQLSNQVIWKAQPLDAVKGNTFLILDLKLVNKSEQDIQLPTRNYIRLSTNGGKDLLSADMHNDPVQVQAISTKYTRIAFPISTSDEKNLTLQVGEIEGKKDIIKLHF